MSSIIERRLLVNYRVDPDVIAGLVPAPLRPQQVDGWAVAGICLIRLGQLRPQGIPGRLGLRSENAAHRIAVEWDGPDGPTTGVYIPRRDSGSLITVLAGGRLFPGEHNRARFDVRETSQNLHVAFTSHDGTTEVSVDVQTATRFQGSELFADLDQASDFFRHGSAGLSATRGGECLDGLELRTDAWRVEPVNVRTVRSTLFDDRDRFPPGSATLDCALLMRDVPVTWSPLRPCGSPVGQRPGMALGIAALHQLPGEVAPARSAPGRDGRADGQPSRRIGATEALDGLVPVRGSSRIPTSREAAGRRWRPRSRESAPHDARHPRIFRALSGTAGGGLGEHGERLGSFAIEHQTRSRVIDTEVGEVVVGRPGCGAAGQLARVLGPR